MGLASFNKRRRELEAEKAKAEIPAEEEIPKTGDGSEEIPVIKDEPKDEPGEAEKAKADKVKGSK